MLKKYNLLMQVFNCSELKQVMTLVFNACSDWMPLLVGPACLINVC